MQVRAPASSGQEPGAGAGGGSGAVQEGERGGGALARTVRCVRVMHALCCVEDKAGWHCHGCGVCGVGGCTACVLLGVANAKREGDTHDVA